MKTFFSIVFLSLIIISCADFIEDNIEDDTIQLVTPMDNFLTLESPSFVWESLEGATGYEIQIVSPTFDSIISFTANTDLGNTTQFDTSLLAGKYEWKIIGYNSAYETESEIYQFEIMEDTVGSLIGQSINLLSPQDDLITNDTVIQFLWGTLLNATSYSIQVANPDFSNSTFIFVDEETTEDNYTTTLSEGTYRWRVRGENDLSVSPYIGRDFTIDLTPPNAPNLLNPLEGDTIVLPATLSWDFDSSSSMDTLYIYKDSLLTPPIFQIATTDADYDFDDTTSQSYFWRVRSVDVAGNISDYSPLQKFYVQ